MRLSSVPSAIRRAGRTATVGAVLGAAALAAAACKNDVSITNPNQLTTQTFWQTASDAQTGLTAAYSQLLRLGTFQRWQGFSYDVRSDEGTSYSPWGDLQNFCKFTFATYDFDVNRDSWTDSYTLVSRANQVIVNVPRIQMDTGQRSQVIAEAKFLRGIAYFHLITLFGGNIPVITDTVTTNSRPAAADSATVFAQIDSDFATAAKVLPVALVNNGGHATAGAAQGMLGKALLQQRNWAAAAAALQPVVSGRYGSYSLDPGIAGYTRLFTATANNNSPESMFEVQMGNPTTASAQGVGGFNMSKMIGPCGPSYCDGRPTKWYEQQFLIDSTVDGKVDPRLDVTLFRYQGDTTTVYAQTWKQRYGTDTATVYWKKYGEYYTGSTDQSWDNQIDFKVLRFADVLLMYAEALNEQGQPAAAAPYVNQVRARVNLKPVSASLSQADMRTAIMKERLLEFGLESQRWLDLGRQQMFSDVATLRAHDSDFNFFTYPKSVLLPIPQTEINLNPNVHQNPGW